ncbi:MAG: Xaa-Pro peptidase family protein [Pseudomonadota bacterium]
MAFADHIDMPPSISAEERATRLAAFRTRMAQSSIDALVLTPGSNIRYFTGLAWGETERFVCAIVDANSIEFVCPRFESGSLVASVTVPMDSAAYWEEHEDPYDLTASLLKKRGAKTIALDNNCSFHHVGALIDAAKDTFVERAAALIAPMRARKSAAELALMTAAKQITLEVHRKVFSELSPGTKPSEVKTEIDRLHRAAGADNGSSFCAVQFAEATAYPHGVPGDPALGPGELILIDTGCTLDGYNSDITRTYALDQVSDEIEQIWRIEKEAQAATFAAARPGVPCENLDKAARSFLETNNLGPDYALPGLPHRVGHGIGLDIHEGPYLVRGDQTPLGEGMCFSNEPMIVVPDAFGVRLEDHFHITKDGAAWFTEPQKSLYEPF